MKRLFYFYITKFFMGMVNWNKGLYEQTIRTLYQTIRKENFILSHEVVNVKRGTRRYSLIFIETKDGKIRVNVGRHESGMEILLDFDYLADIDKLQGKGAKIETNRKLRVKEMNEKEQGKEILKKIS